MLLKIPDALTLETPEEVRALRDLLDAYLRLTTHQTPAQRPEVPALPTLPDRATTGLGRTAPTMGPFYRQALQAAGGTGSLDEVYTAFLELGFASKAKNPKDALNTFLRHHDTEFVKLPPDANGVTRWTLKEESK